MQPTVIIAIVSVNAGMALVGKMIQNLLHGHERNANHDNAIAPPQWVASAMSSQGQYIVDHNMKHLFFKWLVYCQFHSVQAISWLTKFNDREIS